MARVTGPLMSMDASGQLGGAMVFSKWKGRPYVRQLVIPSNPKSGAQTATRSMMAFLSQAWRDLTAPEQATWQDGADQKKISAFNHFTSFNMARWTQFQPPGQQLPVTNAAVTAVIADPVLTPGVRQLTVNDTVTTIGNGWGILVYAKLGSTPIFDKTTVKYIININGFSNGDVATTVLTALEPGDWHVITQAFNDDGVLGDPSADVTATVI